MEFRISKQTSFTLTRQLNSLRIILYSILCTRTLFILTSYLFCGLDTHRRHMRWRVFLLFSKHVDQCFRFMFTVSLLKVSILASFNFTILFLSLCLFSAMIFYFRPLRCTHNVPIPLFFPFLPLKPSLLLFSPFSTWQHCSSSERLLLDYISQSLFLFPHFAPFVCVCDCLHLIRFPFFSYGFTP